MNNNEAIKRDRADEPGDLETKDLIKWGKDLIGSVVSDDTRRKAIRLTDGKQNGSSGRLFNFEGTYRGSLSIWSHDLENERVEIQNFHVLGTTVSLGLSRPSDGVTAYYWLDKED